LLDRSIIGQTWEEVKRFWRWPASGLAKRGAGRRGYGKMGMVEYLADMRTPSGGRPTRGGIVVSLKLSEVPVRGLLD
jgi:hypothetical protein